MYLALARKYRPQNFSEIIGQDPILQTLKNAIKLDRVFTTDLLQYFRYHSGTDSFAAFTDGKT